MSGVSAERIEYLRHQMEGLRRDVMDMIADHREQLQVAEAQRDRLLSLLREAREAIKARDDLLVCYRLGKRVPETLFDRLEKSDKSISRIDAALGETGG